MGWLGDALSYTFPVIAIANGAGGNLFKGGGDSGGGDNNGGVPQYGGKTNLADYGSSPYSSALMDSINSMPGFSPITANSVSSPGSTYIDEGPYKENSYKAKDMSATSLPEYEAMRSRINQQYSQQQGQAQDALDRQFAASGGGPGNGAQAKQTENLTGEIARQKGNDVQEINAEEAHARSGLQQMEDQKEFQSEEAQKGFGFQANQNALARRQQSLEAAAGRQLTASEANAQMGQSAQEFNQQMEQQSNQFKFGANSSIANLNTSWDQAQAEAQNNAFNAALAKWQAEHSGGLLGSGGFLGTGLGASGGILSKIF